MKFILNIPSLVTIILTLSIILLLITVYLVKQKQIPRDLIFEIPEELKDNIQYLTIS